MSRFLLAGLALLMFCEAVSAQVVPARFPSPPATSGLAPDGSGIPFSPGSILKPWNELQIQPYGTGYHDSPYLISTQTPNASDPMMGSMPESGGAAAAEAQTDNGTNPAQNTTTFVVANEYYTLDGNNRINTTYARFKFPIYGGRGSVLFETPYVYYNFKATNSQLPNLGGLGDVKIQGSFNTWTSESKKLTMINFLEMYLPTADNAIVSRNSGNELTAFNLGTGKYVIGPGLGFVYAIAPNFIVAPIYFYEASIFGDPDRVAIRRGKWRLFAMYAWKSGFYVLPEFQVLTNYLTWNNDVYVAPEIGYSHKRTTLYVKPGIGIAPDQNDRQWGIEFGGRFQF